MRLNRREVKYSHPPSILLPLQTAPAGKPCQHTSSPYPFAKMSDNFKSPPHRAATAGNRHTAGCRCRLRGAGPVRR